jgi:hypothetical protein
VSRSNVVRAGVASGVAAFAVLTITTQGFASPDEAWFLQVVNRLLAGDTLYRDVYFGATPLSVQLTRALAWLFGLELLVARALVAACTVTTTLLCCRAAARLGAGLGARWSIALGVAVYGVNQPTPYTPLAIALLAGCLDVTLAWWQGGVASHGARARLIWAGALAGLSFASKQNVGAFALVALLVSIAAGGAARRRWLPGTVVALAAFAAAAGIVLLPVWLGGGSERFARYGITGKDVYLEVGAVPYSAALSRLWTAVTRLPGKRGLWGLYREAAFLLPPLVLAALVSTWVSARGPERRVTSIVAAFAGAGYLVVLPRPGSSHLGFAIPFLLLGAVFAWTRLTGLLRAPLARALAYGWVLWLSTGLLAQLGLSAWRIRSGTWSVSALPHFRGVLIEGREERLLRGRIERVAELAAGRPTFLLGRNTGPHYLVAGIRNPSAFDFPYRSILRRDGESEIIAAIQAGRIPQVIEFDEPEDAQTPVLLRNWVRRHLTAAAAEGPLVLYVNRGS